MERLEAALEKARTDRETVQAPIEIENVSDVKSVPGVDERWAMLKEVKISQRLARRNRITAITQNRQSGSYDLLRSRALRLMQENDWKSLAITSPNKTCGKTTVSINLALSLARQTDLRIVLLDMDMRRPALHKILGHRPGHSLHEVLSDAQPIDSAMVRIGRNLAVGLNNCAAGNPSELLQSKMTKSRLEEIRSTFEPDYILFDMPPMLVSDDNVGFLPMVDCGLLIGAADSTTIPQIDICEKELAELTNVLGVVLNKCQFTENDAGYDYDYY